MKRYVNYFSLYLLILVSIVTPASAAIKKKIYDGDLKKRDNYRLILNQNEKKLRNIKKDIFKLEKKVMLTRNKHLKIIGLKRKINDQIENLNIVLLNQEKYYKNKVHKIERLIKSLYLNQLNDEGIGVETIERVVLLNALKKRTIDFVKTRKSLLRLREKLMLLKTRYFEYNNIEKKITSLIRSITGQKSQKAREFSKEKNISFEIKAILSKWKNKKMNNPNTRVAFSFPVDGFDKMTKEKKGVNFIFKGKRNIKSVADGKVVYVGKLSTYGDIIIINHRNNIRSVLLGSFFIKVKKGASVKRKSVLGYVKSSIGNINKLYMEVRKKIKE